MLQNANAELEQFEMRIMQRWLARPEVSSRRGGSLHHLYLCHPVTEVHAHLGLGEGTETPCRQALPAALGMAQPGRS